MKRVVKYIIAIGGFCLILGGLATFTRFDVCLTQSLEGVNYVLTLKREFPFQRPIIRGDIVSIKGHTPHYTGLVPGKHIFVKRVLGLPGDPIVKHENSLRIRSQTLPLLTETKEGQPLAPLSHTVVPEGTLFVAGDHPRSFDSRYEDFGLVSLERVWGRAIAVFGVAESSVTERSPH